MQIGVIGTGNMGGMLARAFAVDPRVTVRIYNRSPQKASNVAESAANIVVVEKPQDIAHTCDVIFLCTKADDGRTVLKELGPRLTTTQTLATTISAVPVREWEEVTAARVVKVIPSIVQTELSGVILISYGTRFASTDSDDFEGVIGKVATPFVIDEGQIRVCSDLSSCGPAFISLLLLQWAQAAASTGCVSIAEAEHLLCHTLVGVASLLQSGMTLNEILSRVTVPGGVTEAGLNAIQNTAAELFHGLHEATQSHNHLPSLPDFIT